MKLSKKRALPGDIMQAAATLYTNEGRKWPGTGETCRYLDLTAEMRARNTFVSGAKCPFLGPSIGHTTLWLHFSEPLLSHL